MVTIAHGGPYDRYTGRCQLFWFPSAQWLATAGYAVFLRNPRGGHGHQFAPSVTGRTRAWFDRWLRPDRVRVVLPLLLPMYRPR